jgi:pSer/pThr/pTyr-binding forkhead associated (FHA) protein/DNA-directed RNA polymerase subunit RPC12/RpoP
MVKQAKITCRACRARNEAYEKVCHKCGLTMVAAQEEPDRKITCPRCQHSNNAASFFCYACGKYFAEVEPKKINRPATPKKGKAHSSPFRARVIMPGGSEITLTGEPTFIERSDFNGTTSTDLLMKVSRQHILITYDRGKYYVKDYGRDGTGSTNHTKLNGIDIHGKTRKALKDNDKIELAGQAELILIFKLSKCSK